MNEWVNERMNKWINEWINERMNEWTNKWMNGLTNEWMNEWANNRMYKWMKKMNETTNKWIDYWIKEGINKITNEWTDGRLKEWMNESMNELTNEETECWRWLSHVGGDAWCWWRPTLIYKTGEKHEKKIKGKIISVTATIYCWRNVSKAEKRIQNCARKAC